MSVSADSSLIVALFLAEVNSAQADAALAAVAPPVLLTDWHRVEIANAFQRAVRNGRVTAVQAAQLWQDFMGDVAAGRFEIVNVDHAVVYVPYSGSHSTAHGHAWNSQPGFNPLGLRA